MGSSRLRPPRPSSSPGRGGVSRVLRSPSRVVCGPVRSLPEVVAGGGASMPTTGHSPKLLFRRWELQLRGAPHVHIVLGAKSPAELRAARALTSELARLAPGHGFGSVDVARPTTAEAAAAYCSKRPVERVRAERFLPSHSCWRRSRASPSRSSAGSASSGRFGWGFVRHRRGMPWS